MTNPSDPMTGRGGRARVMTGLVAASIRRGWANLPLRVKGLLVVVIPLLPLLATTVAVGDALSHPTRAASTVLAVLSMGAATSAVGGLLVTLLFTSGITRRIEAVTRNAERLARHQPLQALESAADEVGHLARQLEEAARLLDQQDRDRDTATAALRDYAVQVEDLYEHAPCGYHSLDAHGVFLAVNQTELDWLGYRREELVGRKTFADVITDDSRARFKQTFPVFQQTGVLRDVEFEMVTRDGRILPVSISASAQRDASGAFRATRSSVFDISRRKAAEQALSESRNRLEAVLQTMAEGLLIYSADGTPTYWNAAAEQMLGLSPDQLASRTLGPTAWDVRDAEGHPLPYDQWPVSTVLQTGREVRGQEIRVRRGDGSEVHLSVSVAAQLEHGRITAAIVSFIDTTDRHQKSAALAQAKAAAEQANLAKSRFLSRMSHDLRTPLNAMLGFAQLLEAELPPGAHGDELRQIRRGGDHLLRLIDEVLDIARIESGQLSLSPEPLALRDLLEQDLRLVGPLADHRQIALESTWDVPVEVHVLADRRRLQQVVLNLLSNAIKYNRFGGLVTTRVGAGAQGRVRIEVSDTGPGIRPEQLTSLFRPFERLGAEQTAVEGTGLGLALCKGLVEAMDGAIGIESVVDRGTTAWVELPGSEAVPVDVPVSADQPSLSEKVEHIQGGVLYIEDNTANVRLMERLLTRRPNVRLHAVSQGRLGLEYAAAARPRLVLLDLHLPDLPGEEVLRMLWENPATREIPVAVLSADAMPAQVRRLQAAGAIEYLTKPLDLARVLGLIDRVLTGT